MDSICQPSLFSWFLQSSATPATPTPFQTVTLLDARSSSLLLVSSSEATGVMPPWTRATIVAQLSLSTIE